MQVTSILHFEIRTFLYLLAAIIAYRLLTGKIVVRGLFLRKAGPASVSPERIQLLLATLFVSANYMASVARDTGNNMPDIDPKTLYVMGGSSGIYVVGKALTTFRRKASEMERMR